MESAENMSADVIEYMAYYGQYRDDVLGKLAKVIQTRYIRLQK